MSILQAVMTAPLMSGGAPTYTLTPPALNVDEGSSLTFTVGGTNICLLYTSPSPRDGLLSRMPSSS